MFRRLYRTGVVVVAVLAAAGLHGAALAQPARVIGIVSLVADHLTVTGFESTTGSNVHSNPVEKIELQDDGLERSVLRAALRAINEAKAGRAVPLLINDGRLYRDQADLVGADRAQLPDTLLQTLRAQQATQLLLVTKHRDAARMQTGVQHFGSGRVEGLGFYIDRVTPLRQVNSAKESIGYLAPHVYVRVSLIDVADGKLLGTRTVTASQVITAHRVDSGADPWNLLDSAGKVKAIDTMIARELAPALRALLSP